MKRTSLKARKECTNAYQECEDKDRCSCICRGPIHHPECKSYLCCGIDRLRCDGRCKVHEMQKEYEDKKILRDSLSQALTEITFAFRRTDEELQVLENKIEELKKEYK